MNKTVTIETPNTKPSGVTAHSLPCSISHDGPANVSNYFLIESTTKDANGQGWC